MGLHINSKYAVVCCDCCDSEQKVYALRDDFKQRAAASGVVQAAIFLYGFRVIIDTDPALTPVYVCAKCVEGMLTGTDADTHLFAPDLNDPLYGGNGNGRDVRRS